MSEPTVYHSRLTAVSRGLLYAVFTLFMIPVQAVALLLRLPLSRRIPLWYHRVCCRLLGIRLEVFGRRSKARPTLFVANHSSYLDIAVYGALILARSWQSRRSANGRFSASWQNCSARFLSIAGCAPRICRPPRWASGLKRGTA